MEGLAAVGFLTQALRMSAPYALAALGGTFSERAGVVALGLEGMLLAGSFGTTLAAYASGSSFVGALGGMAGGVVLAAIYGLVVLRFGADQVVSAVATNLLAFGLTPFLLGLTYGSTANSPPIPAVSSEVFGEPLFWATVALVALSALVLGRTAFGLRLRAVGDHPDAAESLGVSVMRVRWAAVLISGGLAGLGGAWLALSAGSFTDETGGRGYIALAAVIMGKWRPVAAVLACLFFGLTETIQLQLQTTAGLALPRELVQMLPYLLTLVALCGFIGRSRPPAALGKPR